MIRSGPGSAGKERNEHAVAPKGAATTPRAGAPGSQRNDLSQMLDGAVHDLQPGPGLDALDAIDPAITVRFWSEHCTTTPLRECDACAQTARVATQRPARKAEVRERAAAQPWDEEEAA